MLFTRNQLALGTFWFSPFLSCESNYQFQSGRNAKNKGKKYQCTLRKNIKKLVTNVSNTTTAK